MRNIKNGTGPVFLHVLKSFFNGCRVVFSSPITPRAKFAQAEFLRFGQIHRNTYINAPALVTTTLQLRDRPSVFFAGQISGVEGYVESIATGLMAGRHAAALASGEKPQDFPRETALGSLCHYISGADPRDYQPANIAFDLLPPLDEAMQHRLRHDKSLRLAVT